MGSSLDVTVSLFTFPEGITTVSRANAGLRPSGHLSQQSQWRQKGAEPCPNERWRDHLLRSRRPSWLHRCRKDPSGQRKGASPHSRWCQPIHRPLHWNPSWLRDAHAHKGGPWDTPDVDSEPGDWPGKARRKAQSDSDHLRMWLLSEPTRCLSTHTPFPS